MGIVEGTPLSSGDMGPALCEGIAGPLLSMCQPAKAKGFPGDRKSAWQDLDS